MRRCWKRRSVGMRRRRRTDRSQLFETVFFATEISGWMHGACAKGAPEGAATSPVDEAESASRHAKPQRWRWAWGRDGVLTRSGPTSERPHVAAAALAVAGVRHANSFAGVQGLEGSGPCKPQSNQRAWRPWPTLSQARPTRLDDRPRCTAHNAHATAVAAIRSRGHTRTRTRANQGRLRWRSDLVGTLFAHGEVSHLHGA